MVSSGQTLPWKGETLLWISPVYKKTLEAAGFSVQWFPTAQAAKEALVARFAGKTIGMGGSVTLRDLGLYEALSQRGTVYWHWQQPGPETLAQAAKAQVYLTSVNALAETGQLVNIDGTGNRISAAAGAHETVCYLVGRNKIAPTFQQALWRARNIAAPLNARRLHRKTPCAQGETLRCYDCRSPERICNGLSVLWRPLGGWRPGVPGGGGPGVLIPLVFLRKPSLRGPEGARRGWFWAFRRRCGAFLRRLEQAGIPPGKGPISLEKWGRAPGLCPWTPWERVSFPHTPFWTVVEAAWVSVGLPWPAASRPTPHGPPTSSGGREKWFVDGRRKRETKRFLSAFSQRVPPHVPSPPSRWAGRYRPFAGRAAGQV